MPLISSCCTNLIQRLMAVCIIIATSSVARGLLIQRAISVETVQFSVKGTIDLPIMRNLTDGWGGRYGWRANDVYDFDKGFTQGIRDFQAKTPIHIPGLPQPCENCSFAVNVSVHIIPILYLHKRSMILMLELPLSSRDGTLCLPDKLRHTLTEITTI